MKLLNIHSCTHNKMKHFFLTAHIFLFSSILKCSSAYDIPEIDIFINLAITVKNFYKSSSITMVYDRDSLNWNMHEKLVYAVKLFSRRFVASQIHELNDVRRESIAHQMQLNPFQHMPAQMHLLIIEDAHEMHRFQETIQGLRISLYPWFVIVWGSTLGFNCARPVGNPFNVTVNTRMLVKCFGVPDILRYYSIFKNKTEVSVQGTLINDTIYLNGTNLYFVKNLKGMTLRIAKRPITSQLAIDRQVSYYLQDLLILLKTINNFTTLVTVEDDSYGYYNTTTHTWFGLMRALELNKADIALAVFSISNARKVVADFVLPLTATRAYIYLKIPDIAGIQWNAYFNVINKNVWIGLALLILLSAAVLGILRRRLMKPYITTNLYIDNFIKIWAIFSQQGLSENPPNTSTQILYFFLLISSILLNAVYSASITSYITVLTQDLPFSNYEDFINNRNGYKLIVVRNSKEWDLIQLSDDKALIPLKSLLMKSSELPLNDDDGFQQTCNNKIIFYSYNLYSNTNYMTVQCSLGRLPIPSLNFLSFALKKNSPYTESLNYFLLRLRNNGILNRLYLKYFVAIRNSYESMKMNPKVISVREALPILSIWMIGMAISFIILCIEIIVYNHQRRRTRNEKHLLQINIRPFYQHF